VIQTSDGGYLAVGVTGSFSVSGGADCFAIKLNKSGNLQWAKAFGKEGYDKFFGAVETEDGDYILAGSVDVFGTTEPVKGFVSRVDRNGKVEWQMLYTVPQPAYLELASITTGPKNTFYMGGLYTQDLLTVEPKALLIKLNGSSKILWKKTYDRGNTGMFLSIASVPDGGVIAAGEFDAIKAFVLKARSDGSAVWTKAMPGSMIFAEQAGEGFLTINQTYIGRFFHMVIRSDSSGKTDCGLLKRSSVKIGKARITRQTSNVTTADIVIHFQSPRLSVRRANVKVKNPCASSAPKESACLAIKQP